MIWLVFHYCWSSPLVQILYLLHYGENLCGRQKFTEICPKRVFIACHIIPFLAIVPQLNTGLQKWRTAQAALSEVKSKVLWVWGEKRHSKGSLSSCSMLVLSTSMAWTKQQKSSLVFWCVSSLRMSPEDPDGSRRKVHRVVCTPPAPSISPCWDWCGAVELAASSALPCIVPAAPGCHTPRERRTAQPCSRLLPDFSSDFLSPVLEYFTARVV